MMSKKKKMKIKGNNQMNKINLMKKIWQISRKINTFKDIQGGKNKRNNQLMMVRN